MIEKTFYQNYCQLRKRFLNIFLRLRLTWGLTVTLGSGNQPSDRSLVIAHWESADDFRNRFPDVELDIDRLKIDIVSVGGLTARTDLRLELVERFLALW
ncbi:hypothetical protein FY134_26920 (plasmid) [Agrobacterium fabrum]|uniref:hypothetical protein n=1 Tax=Agrobacterium fabrum TaxID=1176649 RepID=UPI0021CE55D2|nr:hypothetical protein [Agrobacterium fabrum]UXT61313.1 hypothetical protein FY134_26920 [Agrobacterium fabrum]